MEARSKVMVNCVVVLLASAFGLFGSIPTVTARVLLQPAFVPGKSQRELEHIVRQTTDVTCGPAALATVLNEYFLHYVTEEELYEAALRTMRDTTDGVEGVPIVSFRGLIGALDSFGYNGYAVKTDFDNLIHYFSLYDIPVIIHFSHPLPHFTVLLGVTDGMFVIADPSAGRLVMTHNELASHWSGHAMFIQAQSSKKVDVEKRRRQLEDVQQRMDHLNQVKKWL